MKARIFLLTVLAIGFFRLINPSLAVAQVVINEVFANPSGSVSEPNEFIELYNSGTDSATITGWQISDTHGSTKTYIFPEATLGSGNYINFRRSVTGITLNNDGDGVELKDKDNNLIDSMGFEETIEDRSWSRIPNGFGSFINGAEVTEFAANIAPPPTFSPTPTPTSTPTQTPTTTPTSTPVKTSSPNPTPTKTPTLIPKATPTPGPIESAADLHPTSSGSVLGLANRSADLTLTPKPVVSPSAEKVQGKNVIMGIIFIGAGLLLVVGSIYTAIKTSKSSHLQNDI